MDSFGLIIMLQLIFAFSITGLLYALPSDAKVFVGDYQTDHTVDLESVSGDMQGSVEQQMNLPMLELGALVFYSGNIVIDLVMRMLFAIPEMASIVISSVFLFIGIDAYLVAQIQLLIWVAISAYFMIQIIQFLMTVRSQGSMI